MNAMEVAQLLLGPVPVEFEFLYALLALLIVVLVIAVCVAFISFPLQFFKK